MYFYFSFYSSVLLIFFIHGLVYAILLLRKGFVNNIPSDKWLSLFLFLSILFISPWMLGFAGWYDAQPYRNILFYMPFQQLFFMGPIVFFYVQSLLNPSFHFNKKSFIHLVPGFLYLLYSFVVFVVDKWILKTNFFYAIESDKDFDTWYQVSGYISMTIYFFASIQYYNAFKKLMAQVVSYADTILFKWVRNFLIAFLCILLIRVFFFMLSIFIEIDYGGNWWGFFAFSILFYYIAISGYSNAVQTKMNFKTNLFTQQTKLLVYEPNNKNEAFEMYEEVEISNFISTENLTDETEKINTWKEKILDAVVDKCMYKESELSLTDVAKKLNTNVSLLSKYINKGFEMNFNDFINYYRVQAVIEMLQNGEHKKQTLLGIAFDCGFNSKATFNRAFKKVTQKTPKDWIEGLA